jgi:hypothetical protein
LIVASRREGCIGLCTPPVTTDQHVLPDPTKDERDPREELIKIVERIEKQTADDMTFG